MAELLQLAVPQVQPQKVTGDYRIVFIGLYREPAAIVVHLRGTQGELVEVRTATEPEALTLLSQLNTANLSTNSLQKRVLTWVAGKRAELSGTVVGTAD